MNSKKIEAPETVPDTAVPKAKTEKQLTRQKILSLRKAVTSIISGGESFSIPTDTTTPYHFDHSIKCRSNDPAIPDLMEQLTRSLFFYLDFHLPFTRNMI